MVIAARTKMDHNEAFTWQSWQERGMTLIRLILGAGLLAAGRKLFWLATGTAGFVLGAQLATRYFGEQAGAAQGGPVLVVALLAGLVGALLAVAAQQMAIGLAGFLAGGYLAHGLLQTAGVDLAGLAWLAFIVGGVVGMILAGALFDWALIGLSALAGAALVIQPLDLAPANRLLAGGALALVGGLLQAGFLVWERRRKREQPR
jgi:hypothetical protein